MEYIEIDEAAAEFGCEHFRQCGFARTGRADNDNAFVGELLHVLNTKDTKVTKLFDGLRPSFAYFVSFRRCSMQAFVVKNYLT